MAPSRPIINQKNARHKGLFVSFEGQDGSGKTTAMSKIYAILKREGYPAHMVDEFSRSRFGEYLLSTLTKDKFLRVDAAHNSSLTQVFAILNDCVYLTEYEIVPHLEAGGIVLKDRHIDSVVACQLPTVVDEYHINEKDLLEWFKHVVGIVPVIPDLTFYLNAPLETRIQRILRRDRQLSEHRAQDISREDIEIFAKRDRIFDMIAAENKKRIIIYDNNKKDSDAAASELSSVISRRWMVKNRGSR